MHFAEVQFQLCKTDVECPENQLSNLESDRTLRGTAGRVVRLRERWSLDGPNDSLSLRARLSERVVPRVRSTAGLLGEMMPQSATGADATIEVLQAEFFVGAMGSIVVESPSDQQNVALECIDHLRHDGDGPSFADEDGFYAESFLDRVDGAFHEPRVGVYHHSAATVQIDDFDADPRRGVGGDELAKLITNCFGVLIGYEAETDFRASPRRNHRFATFSLVTSEKSMDIESWAGPSSLERAKTFFTGQFLNA